MKEKAKPSDILERLDKDKAKVMYGSESMAYLNFQNDVAKERCGTGFLKKLDTLGKFKRVRLVFWPNDEGAQFIAFFFDAANGVFIANLEASGNTPKILALKNTERYSKFNAALLQELAEKLDLLKK